MIYIIDLVLNKSNKEINVTEESTTLKVGTLTGDLTHIFFILTTQDSPTPTNIIDAKVSTDGWMDA